MLLVLSMLAIQLDTILHQLKSNRNRATSAFPIGIVPHLIDLFDARAKIETPYVACLWTKCTRTRT